MSGFGRNHEGVEIMPRETYEAFRSTNGRRAIRIWVGLLLTAVVATAQPARDLLVLTSTNASPNNVLVFRLSNAAAASLSLVTMLPTGGNGGATGPGAGAVQFSGGLGAVVNYGSNTVSQLLRVGDWLGVTGQIKLAPNCVKPVSTAISGNQLFVVGATCAESHAWPFGFIDGSVVSLADPSAAQIA